MKPILIVSHERSGTHFLINSVAANFGLSDQVRSLPPREQSGPAALDSSEPQIIRKSHHQSIFFGPIDDVLDVNKIIYVIRDCRGVMVSLFHYFRVSRGNESFPHFDKLHEIIDANPTQYGFDAAYSYFKSHDFPTRWAKHIQTWQPYFDRICVVTYEDLTLRFAETIWRIAHYLERTPRRNIRPPSKQMYSVAPYRGVLNGWQDEMCQRDSARICRMVWQYRRWLTS